MNYINFILSILIFVIRTFVFFKWEMAITELHQSVLWNNRKA